MERFQICQFWNQPELVKRCFRKQKNTFFKKHVNNFNLLISKITISMNIQQIPIWGGHFIEVSRMTIFFWIT